MESVNKELACVHSCNCSEIEIRRLKESLSQSVTKCHQLEEELKEGNRLWRELNIKNCGLEVKNEELELERDKWKRIVEEDCEKQECGHERNKIEVLDSHGEFKCVECERDRYKTAYDLNEKRLIEVDKQFLAAIDVACDYRHLHESFVYQSKEKNREEVLKELKAKMESL